MGRKLVESAKTRLKRIIKQLQAEGRQINNQQITAETVRLGEPSFSPNTLSDLRDQVLAEIEVEAAADREAIARAEELSLLREIVENLQSVNKFANEQLAKKDNTIDEIECKITELESNIAVLEEAAIEKEGYIEALRVDLQKEHDLATRQAEQIRGLLELNLAQREDLKAARSAQIAATAAIADLAEQVRALAGSDQPPVKKLKTKAIKPT
jgi:hypothetical protein